MNKFNVYDNIRTPQVKNLIAIDEWFSLIRQSEYSSLIEAARPFEKGNLIYETNKKIIPAITYNFTFNTHKSNINISGNTGLIYIDVDDLLFDISNLDLNKVYACYKSFGGKGYSILVKVDGLTFENYSATHDFICTELGLSSYSDKNAVKATQFNVLSYDPNIYVNDDSFLFQAVNPVIDTESNVDDFVLSSILKEKKRKAYSIELSTKSNGSTLRYDNLDEITFEGNWELNWEGWFYVKAFLPFNKIGENRNATLLSYGTNMVYLNPTLTPKGLTTILNKVSQSKFTTPVDNSNIKRVVSTIFKQKEAGTLKPIYYNKPRKILFAKESMLTKDEKLVIVRREIAKHKTDVSREKIYNVIEGWDFKLNGKITVRSVTKFGKLGNNTVTKFWSEFKDYVNELNKINMPAKNKAVNKVASIPKNYNISKKVKIQSERIELPVTIDKDEKLVDYYDGLYPMVFSGYKTFEELLSGLTEEQKFQVKFNMLEHIAVKAVNTFSIEVDDRRLSFFSNETIIPAHIQLQSIAV